MTIRMALLGSAAIVAGYAAPALAQADPTPQPKAQVLGDDSDIVVTGSRIRRQDLAGVGPATVVTAEQIQNTGIVNIETALQRLPAMSTGTEDSAKVGI